MFGNPCRLHRMLLSLLLVLLIIIKASLQSEIIFFPEEPNLEEGCHTPEGTAGRCLLVQKCSLIQDRIVNEGYHPKVCRFWDKTPIVCCPLAASALTGNTAVIRIVEPVAAPTVSFECGVRGEEEVFVLGRKKRSLSDIQHETENRQFGFPSDPDSPPHLRFSAPPVPLGTRPPPPPVFLNEPFPTTTPRIEAAVGGFVSVPHSWPWMAIMGSRDIGLIQWFCDGVLLNDRWVITASHCFLDFKTFFVRLGEHNHQDTSPESARLDYGVEVYVFHPGYNGNDGYNDLGLMKLDKVVEFTDKIRPVCLPWGKLTGANFVGESVTLTGWGTTKFGGAPSDVLREAYVEIFDASVCQESYSTLFTFRSVWPEGMSLDNIICAGTRSGGVDACQGDSGGPLVIGNDIDNKYTLVGIISKGHGCGLAEFPGLYAPVSNDLDWIKKIAFANQ